VSRLDPEALGSFAIVGLALPRNAFTQSVDLRA
jgi:hypothetical protein